jgi:hypothetical protein
MGALLTNVHSVALAGERLVWLSAATDSTVMSAPSRHDRVGETLESVLPSSTVTLRLRFGHRHKSLFDKHKPFLHKDLQSVMSD